MSLSTMRATRSPSHRGNKEDALFGNIILLILFTVFSFSPALAQGKGVGFDPRRLPVLPTDLTLSPETFRLETVAHDETPPIGPALAFHVRLPKNWVKAADFGQGGERPLPGLISEIARYYSPPNLDSRSIFSVMTVHIEHRMSLRDWVINQALVNGYALQGLREIDKNHVESQYVTIEGDMNYRVRASSWMEGTRILTALYKVPDTSWDTEKHMQAACIASFAPTALPPDDNRGIDVYDFMETMQFDYPLSWRMKVYETHTPERMKVMIVNGGENEESPKGWVNVQLIHQNPEIDSRSEISSAFDFIKKAGLEVGSPIETLKDFAYGDTVTFHRVEVFDANPADGRPGKYEVWRAILVLNEFLGIVTMATPARNDAFQTWAINAAVFRRLVETLGPYDGRSGAAGDSDADLERKTIPDSGPPANDDEGPDWHKGLAGGDNSGSSTRGHIGQRQ